MFLFYWKLFYFQTFFWFGKRQKLLKRISLRWKKKLSHLSYTHHFYVDFSHLFPFMILLLESFILFIDLIVSFHYSKHNKKRINLLSFEWRKKVPLWEWMVKLKYSLAEISLRTNRVLAMVKFGSQSALT